MTGTDIMLLLIMTEFLAKSIVRYREMRPAANYIAGSPTAGLN
jgi:hypothetical protein